VAIESSIPLQVVRDRTRMSRIAKRRLLVLLLVQLLLIAHVVLWLLSTRYGWFGGFTISPIEPSESIETVSDGIINAGAMFFAAALLSTALLGRWFCGWGCHVLLLQDGCYWAMRKIGVRPRAFRSRLLMLAPLTLALYMFVWPVVYRLCFAPPDIGWNGFTSHILVRDFWATFPGLTVAVFFLGICGFLTVYMLGSKGFCTYGCPYGGFFAPLDRFAPLRIRVNDNCQGCAECTAVCSSNVRVHEEVATHGMVVDSGCMKTMDCIEACPNDALSLGIGPIAVGQPRPRRTWDLTWPQEVAMAVLMLALFLIWRGAYGVVPMLMAIGMAACGAWLCWKAWSVLRSPNAKWLTWQLRLKGRIKKHGVVLLFATALFLSLTVATGIVQGASMYAGSLLQPVSVRQSMATGPAQGAALVQVDRALAAYASTRTFKHGGWAVWENPADRFARVRLLAMRGKVQDAWLHMVLVMAHARPDEGAWLDGLSLHSVAGSDAYTQEWAEDVLEAHPDWGRFRIQFVTWLADTGRTSDAVEVARQALSTEDARRLMLRAVELLNAGKGVEALPLMQDYLRATPKDTLARAALARLQLSLGNRMQAVKLMQQAREEAPNLPPAQQQALAQESAAFNAMLQSQ
jgi:ferredoxin